jgi:2-polyprenyl-3-methyl-5-hydroxy-6-metoxy-1,4-benzoquinol methylase
MNPILAPFLQRQRYQAVKPYLIGDILDLGCGYGHLLDLLRPDQGYAGVDADLDVIARTQERHPSRTFYRCDLDHETLSLDQTFDTVVMLAILEHLANPENLIEALGRHLKPGGRAVLTTPTPLGNRIHHFGSHLGLFYIEAAMDHKTIFDRRILKNLLETHGFHVSVYRTFLLGGNQLCVAVPVG